LRIAVVSDIHSNGDALDAVARELDRLAPDRVVHLGDLVGYNAEPEKCVRWAMANCSAGVRGNHDAVVCGKAAGEFFHRPALQAARWSARQMSDAGMSYLAGLPVRMEIPGGILLVHGAPSDPDRYLFLLEDAEEEMDLLAGQDDSRIVLYGHTHLPAAVVRRKDGNSVSAPLKGFHLEEGEAAMLNPGSVGQPRDRDSRSSFLLLDTESAEAFWIRVPYDVDRCRKKVLEAGLPEFFAARLADGT
jgi:predicted phosphodiesterase